MRKTVGLLLVVVMLLSGCSFFSAAELSEMIPGMSSQMDKLECWLTIEFKKYPKGNPRDVRVEFSSMALQRTEVFDWEYIAAHDVISLGMMKGFKANTASSPEAKPPLNTPVKVNYPLHAKPYLKVEPGDTILLTAKLFWGGKEIASSERTIEHVYRPAS